MYYRIILGFLICIFIQSCENNYKPPKYGTLFAYYILNTYLPEQQAREQRAAQCSQPNAIQFGGGYKDIYCINNKVSEGLIFDANTMAGIKVDTLSPGQSFFCQCGSTFYYNQWQRGNKVEDNPSPGVSITLILFNSSDSSKTNTSLKSQTHYNQTDNLYCITRCPTNSENIQYQFLKIR